MSYSSIIASQPCPRCHSGPKLIRHYTALRAQRGKAPSAINDHWDAMAMWHYIRESRNRLCTVCDLHWFVAFDEPALVQEYATLDILKQVFGMKTKEAREALSTFASGASA